MSRFIIHFFIFVCFLLNGSYLYSQKDTDSKFPIVAPKNCNKIGGNSWRCCGLGTLMKDGKFFSNIVTSSNRLEGFTGSVEFTFYTKDGRIIHQIQSAQYRVKGKSKRTSKFTTTIPKKIVDSTVSIRGRGIQIGSGKNIRKLFNEH